MEIRKDYEDYVMLKSKFGLVKLPGIITEFNITGDLNIKSDENQKTKRKLKVFKGYNDKEISVSLVLVDDDGDGRLYGYLFGNPKKGMTRYEKLAFLEEVFTDKYKKNGHPLIYRIITKHTKSRNLKTVLFSKMDSTESSNKNKIEVSIAFEEYKAPKVKRRRKKKRSKWDKVPNAPAGIELAYEVPGPEGIELAGQ